VWLFVNWLISGEEWIVERVSQAGSKSVSLSVRDLSSLSTFQSMNKYGGLYDSLVTVYS